MAPGATIDLDLVTSAHLARRREKQERARVADALVDAWLETHQTTETLASAVALLRAVVLRAAEPDSAAFQEAVVVAAQFVAGYDEGKHV